eukprot:5531544-Alexandrium_andersonii.AAC.1
MSASLVGSEMCIRDRRSPRRLRPHPCLRVFLMICTSFPAVAMLVRLPRSAATVSDLPSATSPGHPRQA